MITASRLDQVRHCLGSLLLPQSASRNAYQDAGNDRDAEFTKRINSGDIPEEMAKRWPGATWRTQVPFAYNWSADTGRELPVTKAGHRDYAAAETMEICGTADVVGEMPGLIIVGDKKSFDPNVPRAAINGQIHIAALAMCRAREIKAAHVFIDHEARPFDVATLDDWDLAAFADIAKRIAMESFSAAAKHRAGEPLQLAAGYWCRWCNAFDACPKQQELKQLVGSGELPMRVEGAIPLVDDAKAAELYEIWEAVKILQKRMSEALHARAAEKPIPVRNGKVFTKVVTEGSRQLDGDKAYALLRDRYGQDVADNAVTREATQAGIKHALDAAGVKGVAAKVATFVDDLNKMGGVTRKPSTKFEEVPAEKQLVKVG